MGRFCQSRGRKRGTEIEKIERIDRKHRLAVYFFIACIFLKVGQRGNFGIERKDQFCSRDEICRGVYCF